MSKALVIEDLDGVMVARFDRPEIRNPLSIEVLVELNKLLKSVTRGIVFTGREDVFASGADLREIADVTPETAREFALRGQSLMRKIAGLRRPAIAAINGYCFGGALDLALACKHRIASPNAVFSHPGANLGIITGWGGTQRLPRLIGRANALEMLFTAGRVDAEEALRLGLIDKIAVDPVEAAIRKIMDA